MSGELVRGLYWRSLFLSGVGLDAQFQWRLFLQVLGCHVEGFGWFALWSG